MKKISVTAAIRRVWGAEGASARVLFGLAVVPLIGLVGAACDYTNAATARTEMQAVADATARMLAQEPAGLTPAAVRQKADAYFRARYQRQDVADLEIAAAYGDDGARHVSVTTQGRLDTQFMSLFGVETMMIHGEAVTPDAMVRPSN